MRIQQLQEISQNFVQELTKANNGQKNSLAFLRNFVPTPFVKDGEVFQVLVVGGSICRNVLMKRHGKEFTILSHYEKEQPIFHTKGDFLAFLSLEVDKTVTHVALNFAFPIQPTVRDKKLDGILLYGTKEHTFDGLQGQKVGKEIEDYMKKEQNRDIQICVANDTICLLLSGQVKHTWHELACAIVGTGYNMAFFTSEHEAINLESGGFNNMPQDDIDREVDAASLQPGMQINEKQVSGAYLYRYFNHVLLKKGISYPEITSTKALDDLARNNSEVGIHAEEVLQRSAELVAAQVAAIAEFKKCNIVCVVEGSLFWKGYHYKETVEETLKKLSPKQQISFIHVENSSVLGAAKLIA
jgi:hexokinase